MEATSEVQSTAPTDKQITALSVLEQCLNEGWTRSEDLAAICGKYDWSDRSSNLGIGPPIRFYDDLPEIAQASGLIAKWLDIARHAWDVVKHSVRRTQPVTEPIPAACYTEAAIELIERMQKMASSISEDVADPLGGWETWNATVFRWESQCDWLLTNEAARQLKALYRIELTECVRALTGLEHSAKVFTESIPKILSDNSSIRRCVKPKMIQKRLFCGRNMAHLKREWGKPAVPHKGRRAAWYDLDLIRPILEKQFPDAQSSKWNNLEADAVEMEVGK